MNDLEYGLAVSSHFADDINLSVNKFLLIFCLLALSVTLGWVSDLKLKTAIFVLI
ncbi:MAG: hypothetical protein J5768_06295 [Spirochaetales bacterium]|nr:hypothetical protein [Spirochaetales bacterium]